MAQQDKATSDVVYDVIVIGAGLSGLTAAYHFTKTNPGCKVLVLEAKDRVGGRTLTVPMQGSKGIDFWDLGGQWVCKTQHHILWLLDELGLEQYPQYSRGTKLQQRGTNPRVLTYEGDTPSFPPHVLLDLLRFEIKADSLAKDVSYEKPWTSRNADEYDSLTFEQFIERETWTKDARDVIDGAFELVNGSRGRGHSALNYLFYISSGITNRSLYDNKNAGAQETKIKGGAQPISTKLQERIGKSYVLLSEPVVSIDQSSSSKVKVQTLSGKSFNCKYVINSMPLHCVGSLQYLPESPAKRLKLIGHTKMGSLYKFIVTYKTAFWRDKGYSGEIINFSKIKPNEGSDYFGPLQYVVDATTKDGAPALVGFINNNLYWSDVEETKTKEAILKHLATFLGSEATSPLDIKVKDWSKEPYNGGCPVTMMMTGAVQYWDEIRKPFGRIHWAGTETASQWMGYLSGAVQSGLRAADEISNRLNPSGSSKSDLLTSLDQRGVLERKTGPGWAYWFLSSMSWAWTLGKVGLGLAVAGVLAARAQLLLQGD